MASLLKLKTDIKKIKAAIASKATSGAIKTKLRGKLTSLENELDKLQPNKRKPKTTGPKSESALVRLAKKRRTNQGLSTSKSDIERDAIRPAKKAGKRISANGNRYYEYRDNRVDNRQPPKKYRKLADGGETSSKNFNTKYNVGRAKYVINYHDGKKTHKDGSPFYDIATFKNMKDFLAYKKKLNSEGYKEYKDGGYMADGGTLKEKDKLSLKILRALSGFSSGRGIGGVLETLGYSKYRFNQYATKEEYDKVKKELDKLVEKDYVEGNTILYKITKKGAEYLSSFGYGDYMADGGKTQGYDDKKDESLGMTRGKLSLKDFVGNRAQKEHARRDDARFEERGKMDHGGYMAKGGDLSLIKKKYEENEDENAHSENVVLLAKHFGTKADLAKAKEILDLHEKEGYLSSENGKKRTELHYKLIDKARAEMGKQGIEFEKGGYMADGGAVSTRELNKKIKSWYMKSYPTDDMGKDIRDEITFKSLWNMMHQGYDVYEVLDVYDSVVRERVFEKLSQILGVDYDVVYNKWLGYADGGMMSKGGKVGKYRIVPMIPYGVKGMITQDYEKIESFSGTGDEAVARAKEMASSNPNFVRVEVKLPLKTKTNTIGIVDGQNKNYSDGGYMAKGGKTKDQEVVRGYFEDEAYEYGKGGEVMYLTSNGTSQSLVTDKSNATPMFIMDAEYYISSNPKNSAVMVAEKIDKTLPDRVGKNYIVKITKKNKMADGGITEETQQIYFMIKPRLVYELTEKADKENVELEFIETNEDGNEVYRAELTDAQINDFTKLPLQYDFEYDYADGGMMANGGSVAKGNYEMLFSQAKEVMHHAEELMQVAKPDMDIEAWVVAKAERATTDLSDITHYLDGLKMAMGGMVKHNAHKVNA